MEAASGAAAAAAAVAELAQLFECPVCFQVPRSKKNLSFCFRGHFVCKTCADLWKRDNRFCPVCRTQPFVEMEQNILLEKIFGLVLNGHKFRCVQNLAGCQVTGSAHQMDLHEPNCMYQQFKCPNKNCSSYKTLLQLTSPEPNPCFEQLPVTGQNRIDTAIPYEDFLQDPSGTGILPTYNRVFMFHYFGLQLPGYILLHVENDKLCAEAWLMGKKLKGQKDKFFFNLALSVYCQGYGSVAGLRRANFSSSSSSSSSTDKENRQRIQVSEELLTEWWHEQQARGPNRLCPMRRPHIHFLVECSVPVGQLKPSAQPIQRFF